MVLILVRELKIKNMRIKNVKDLIKVRKEEYEEDYQLVDKDILKILKYKSLTVNDKENLINLINSVNTYNLPKKYLFYTKEKRILNLFIELLNREMFDYSDIILKTDIDINDFFVQCRFEKLLTNKVDNINKILYLTNNGFVYENIFFNIHFDEERNKKSLNEFEEKESKLKMFLREMKINKLKYKIHKL